MKRLKDLQDYLIPRGGRSTSLMNGLIGGLQTANNVLKRVDGHSPEWREAYRLIYGKGPSTWPTTTSSYLLDASPPAKSLRNANLQDCQGIQSWGGREAPVDGASHRPDFGLAQHRGESGGAFGRLHRNPLRCGRSSAS